MVELTGSTKILNAPMAIPGSAIYGMREPPTALIVLCRIIMVTSAHGWILKMAAAHTPNLFQIQATEPAWQVLPPVMAARWKATVYWQENIQVWLPIANS